MKKAVKVLVAVAILLAAAAAAPHMTYACDTVAPGDVICDK